MVNTLLEIPTRKLIFVLVMMTVLLTGVGAGTMYRALLDSQAGFNLEKLTGIPRLFNLAAEGNIPSWFKGAILFLSAELLFMISTSQRNVGGIYARHWRDLGIVFTLLSVDELATLHKELGREITTVFETTGVFLYGWVIVGLVFVVAFAVVYAGFVRSLPLMPQLLFALAGVIYVGGALGLKMFEGWYVAQHAIPDVNLIIIIAVRQFLQMLGVTIFLYSLLKYARHNVEDAVLRVVQ